MSISRRNVFGIKKECINYDSEIEKLANYISEIHVLKSFSFVKPFLVLQKKPIFVI